MSDGLFADDLEMLADAYLSEEPDASYRSEIESLVSLAKRGEQAAATELRDRLVGQLHFGTAGLRAKMEAGYTRINAVTVAKAAHALGRVMLAQGKHAVVLGFDARNRSDTLAEEAARVLQALGLTVHFFGEKIATPLCAFAVKEVGADAALMVTASHNPPEDNGVKIYWSEGEQIVSPIDLAIEKEMASAPSRSSMHQANSAWQRLEIGPQVFDAYFAWVKRGSIHPMSRTSSLRIVYTPLHGAGKKWAARALAEAGFTNVQVVPSQGEPDGNFPTLPFPNPEEEGALDEALKVARSSDADLILANDPDADRLAVVVKNASGEWVPLTGNEIGVLLGADAIFHAKTGAKQKLAISTLVSSRMLGAIAKAEGVSYAETLTGFSRISHEAMRRERGQNEQFIFGYEEALGYCVGNRVRDKDGVSAAVRFAELFVYLAEQGQSVFAELDRLALKYGVFRGLQGSIRLQGQGAQKQANDLMQRLQRDQDALPAIGFSPAEEQPSANVLVHFNPKDTRLIIRPSGTEPKIKFYLEAVGKADSQARLPMIRNQLDTSLQKIRQDLSQLFGL